METPPINFGYESVVSTNTFGDSALQFDGAGQVGADAEVDEYPSLLNTLQRQLSECWKQRHVVSIQMNINHD